MKAETNHFAGVGKMVTRGSQWELEQTIATNVAGILGA